MINYDSNESYEDIFYFHFALVPRNYGIHERMKIVCYMSLTFLFFKIRIFPISKMNENILWQSSPHLVVIINKRYKEINHYECSNYARFMCE
jgi:hypothetical protein